MPHGLKIVLASASPRRKRILQQVGIRFKTIEPIEVEEIISGKPRTVVITNANRKASAVAKELNDSLVVGCDTIVTINSKIMGKATNLEEAERMLKALQGREHIVVSGLAVINAKSGQEISEIVETRVFMLSLSDKKIKKYVDTKIKKYVDTGEPIGKAGGYAIQGLGATFIEKIDGCFYNVVGLPISRLNQILEKLGYNFFPDLLKTRL
jgi:septum formation protein